MLHVLLMLDIKNEKMMWKRNSHLFQLSLSHVQLFVTPWNTAHQAYLSITNFQNLSKLMST